ncbi:spectinomycin phosphotransferase [Micromonospora rhizosphaerae]|uniref:Spectinomycin phosphotransferase n=1 Tax=Micromonospora rhizosphaerae TaxID=568872 RepID=A0A1C6SET5_9ACTN|nr:phosphotransferase [Micromonospora rhizosphaerae]SCL27921.1 spectinomycin phosphotransferase [Micromonospora rhizosphaerae]
MMAKAIAGVDDRLAGWVADDFGLTLASAVPVGYGADAAAELWRATTMDGGDYAVKLSGGGTAAGLVVTAELARQGLPGVVAPLATRDGQVCGVREGRRLSVVPWASDERAIAGGMRSAHWRAYGEVLAATHGVTVTDELAALPREDHTHAAIGAATREMDRRLRTVGGSADRWTRDVAVRWREAADDVATLLDRVDRLGAELRDRPADLVVCHGDPHLGNLLLGPEGRVWLIDWDDAVLAPRERDLMFVVGGVLAFAPVTAAQQAAFFEGYGSMELEPLRLAYHLGVRALDDISSWAGDVADADRPEADRVRALRIVEGLLSPVGLITLARQALRDLGRWEA